MRTRTWIISLFSITQLLVQAQAQGVMYTWVDSQGVTHFSDLQPPEDVTVPAGITQMDLPQTFTEADPGEEYYSITNQWKRAQQERAEKDKLALQRGQLRLEWYRARQQTREAELAASARAAETQTPLIIVREGPYFRSLAFRHRRSDQDRYHNDPGHRPHWIPHQEDSNPVPVKYSLGPVKANVQEKPALQVRQRLGVN